MTYLPEFLKDERGQQDIVKAFYVWLVMVENKREMDEPDIFQCMQRRDYMCDPLNFQILLLTFLDFLSLHGWQIYRTRSKDEHADLEKSKRDLLNLHTAWVCLVQKDGPDLRDDQYEQLMQPFIGWFDRMPKNVQEAWAKRLKSKEL